MKKLKKTEEKQAGGSAPEYVPRCAKCRNPLAEELLKQNLGVCPHCQKHYRITVGEWENLLLDPGSFKEWKKALVSVDPLKFVDKKSYRDRLIEARAKTDLRDAAVVGRGKINGIPTVLAFLDFEFMGGTMGSVVGEKIAFAFSQAIKLNLPVVSVVASGGARMQEGILSLLQMAKTAQAAARHHQAGLLYISVLTNPTTGGVSASFASLGDIILAEPEATIGFIGPRVIEQTLKIKLPPGSHTAEFWFNRGLIDKIVPRKQLKITLANLLSHLTRKAKPKGEKTEAPPRLKPHKLSSWEVVKRARAEDRPIVRDYIRRLFSHFIELHGDRYFAEDPVLVGGLAELEGEKVMVLGTDRKAQRGGMVNPEGYRKGVRLMKLAEKFKLPLITLIDTPGANPGIEAEKRGIARSLAESLFTLTSLKVPVISIIVGEGGSGGALALAAGDRVLMQEFAIYSVISPEGAAVILWNDPQKAEELSQYLRLTAPELLKLRIIDGIIPEPEGGAQLNPEQAASFLKSSLLYHLAKLQTLSPAALLKQRYQRYQGIGVTGVYWQEVIKLELKRAIEGLKERFKKEPAAKAEGGYFSSSPPDIC